MNYFYLRFLEDVTKFDKTTKISHIQYYANKSQNKFYWS